MRVAISPISISFLITSALPRPSSSATSRTVAPEGTLVATASPASSGFAGLSSSIGLRRRPPRRRGGRCGGGPPICSRREAWESMTTRRRFLPPPPPVFAPAPSPPAGRTGRVEDCAAFGAAAGASCFWAVAVPAPDLAAPPSPFAALSAASASDSSTLEAAALASIPAALSAASRSLLAIPCAFAIS